MRARRVPGPASRIGPCGPAAEVEVDRKQLRDPAIEPARQRGGMHRGEAWRLVMAAGFDEEQSAHPVLRFCTAVADRWLAAESPPHRHLQGVRSEAETSTLPVARIRSSGAGSGVRGIDFSRCHPGDLLRTAIVSPRDFMERLPRGPASMTKRPRPIDTVARPHPLAIRSTGMRRPPRRSGSLAMTTLHMVFACEPGHEFTSAIGID